MCLSLSVSLALRARFVSCGVLISSQFSLLNSFFSFFLSETQPQRERERERERDDEREREREFGGQKIPHLSL